MNEVIVRVMDLPARVSGVTIEDENGDYNVTINANCGYYGQRAAYRHEMQHIERDDFRNGKSIEEVEGKQTTTKGRTK